MELIKLGPDSSFKKIEVCKYDFGVRVEINVRSGLRKKICFVLSVPQKNIYGGENIVGVYVLSPTERVKIFVPSKFKKMYLKRLI